MAKSAKKVETKSGVKGMVETDKLAELNQGAEFRKPGKVRNGKMNFDTGEIEYDDEKDEDPVAPSDEDDFEDDVTSSEDDDFEDDDEEPAPVKKGKKQLVEDAKKQLAKEKSGKKSTKASDSKGSVELEGDTLKLRPSQRPVPPAALRKTVEVRKDYKGDLVTINDLIEEYGMDGKKIRRIVRALGYKAPSTQTQGFGAKARYEFEVDSPILKKIRAALAEEQEG